MISSVHRVVIERDGSAVLVVASGEVDAFVAPELDSAFAEVAHERRVVADLTRVSFLDSTALGVLVRGTQALGERGAAVRVVLPRGPARRIFELTELDGVLPLAETRRVALDELAGGR
jgi:anti-sigma B factor antagonist